MRKYSSRRAWEGRRKQEEGYASLDENQEEKNFC
jgi:hypothetical protein